MKTIAKNIIVLALAGVMTTGCSMWNNETNGAVLGGIGGTLVGGALGEMLGGHHGSHVGMQIGATIGTVAGASAGREQDRIEAQERYNYSANADNDSYYDRENGLTYTRINRDGDLIFRSNSTRLEGSSERNLYRISRDLKRCSNDIYIYGSTDSRERNPYQLSSDRANAVAQYLVDYGISRRRIHTVALGNDSPIGNNDSQRGRELNRSVEVFIVR